jgi:hypothetical protein
VLTGEAAAWADALAPVWAAGSDGPGGRAGMPTNGTGKRPVWSFMQAKAWIHGRLGCMCRVALDEQHVLHTHTPVQPAYPACRLQSAYPTYPVCSDANPACTHYIFTGAYNGQYDCYLRGSPFTGSTYEFGNGPSPSAQRACLKTMMHRQLVSWGWMAGLGGGAWKQQVKPVGRVGEAWCCTCCAPWMRV